MGWKIQLFVVLVATIVALYFAGFFTPVLPPLNPGSGWWAHSERGSAQIVKTISKYKIEFSREGQLDLKRRLNKTRWFDSIEGTNFKYGIRSDYMKKVVEYWKNDYDWKKQEKILNQFDHFKTNIEGIDIHFVHVKPKNLPQGIKLKPILMVHGWPGSFYEFYKVIPMLTDPTNHGGNADDAFEVICPSIPGYGFSEAAHKPGLGADDVARIFHVLMTERLKFETYYVQGGDWGALVVDIMSLFFPKNILGHHSNMVTYQPPYELFLTVLGGYTSPSLIFSREKDQKKVFPAMEIFGTMLEETGYMHLQATKPDTVGHALTDSPVGLAAYILEKFSGWTHKNGPQEPDGGLGSWEMDELLNNIMIYWISGSITSSMRLYKEQIPEALIERKFDKYKSYVPLGVADFPDELFATRPESWLRHKYQDIVSYTEMPKGGHFAAFEQPKLLGEDVRQFVRKVEAQRKVKA